jgi:hypothetical protein
MLTPDGSSPSRSVVGRGAKRQRVLACILCQQRKIKCDRIFPCANCTKSSTRCVPAGDLPRQRRRRFPERELLDRLRHYENILRQHNLDIEPLHKQAPAVPDTKERGVLHENRDAPSEIEHKAKSDIYRPSSIGSS